MVQGTKSIILNNSYKIYCVKCPWFWFWLIFVPRAARAVFCSMDETLDIHLPPWFTISNNALKSNSLKKVLTFIEIYKTLFNSKWMRSCVCPIWNVTACMLMEESAIERLPSHYSICVAYGTSQLLYEQLLSSVPYATLCPIRKGMFIIFVYWTTY